MLRVAVARVTGWPIGGDASPPDWLGVSERTRWTQLQPRRRAAFLASRALLRGLLQAATGVAADAWEVSAPVASAPVARSDAVVADVHVSLSHRLGWVAAAVAHAPVGVDIECLRPTRSPAAERAALMLSPAELAAWQASPPPDRERDLDLLRTWVAKEAWFKATPADAAEWDFRRVAADVCGSALANVATWASDDVQLAACCADADALASAEVEGAVPDGFARSSSRHVHRVAADA